MAEADVPVLDDSPPVSAPPIDQNPVEPPVTPVDVPPPVVSAADVYQPLAKGYQHGGDQSNELANVDVQNPAWAAAQPQDAAPTGRQMGNPDPQFTTRLNNETGQYEVTGINHPLGAPADPAQEAAGAYGAGEFWKNADRPFNAGAAAAHMLTVYASRLPGPGQNLLWDRFNTLTTQQGLPADVAANQVMDEYGQSLQKFAEDPNAFGPSRVVAQGARVAGLAQDFTAPAPVPGGAYAPGGGLVAGLLKGGAGDFAKMSKNQLGKALSNVGFKDVDEAATALGRYERGESNKFGYEFSKLPQEALDAIKKHGTDLSKQTQDVYGADLPMRQQIEKEAADKFGTVSPKQFVESLSSAEGYKSFADSKAGLIGPSGRLIDGASNFHEEMLRDAYNRLSQNADYPAELANSTPTSAASMDFSVPHIAGQAGLIRLRGGAGQISAEVFGKITQPQYQTLKELERRLGSPIYIDETSAKAGEEAATTAMHNGVDNIKHLIDTDIDKPAFVGTTEINGQRVPVHRGPDGTIHVNAGDGLASTGIKLGDNELGKLSGYYKPALLGSIEEEGKRTPIYSDKDGTIFKLSADGAMQETAHKSIGDVTDDPSFLAGSLHNRFDPKISEGLAADPEMEAKLAAMDKTVTGPRGTDASMNEIQSEMDAAKENIKLKDRPNDRGSSKLSAEDFAKKRAADETATTKMTDAFPKDDPRFGLNQEQRDHYDAESAIGMNKDKFTPTNVDRSVAGLESKTGAQQTTLLDKSKVEGGRTIPFERGPKDPTRDLNSGLGVDGKITLTSRQDAVATARASLESESAPTRNSISDLVSSKLNDLERAFADLQHAVASKDRNEVMRAAAVFKDDALYNVDVPKLSMSDFPPGSDEYAAANENLKNSNAVGSVFGGVQKWGGHAADILSGFIGAEGDARVPNWEIANERLSHLRDAIDKATDIADQSGLTNYGDKSFGPGAAAAATPPSPGSATQKMMTDLADRLDTAQRVRGRQLLNPSIKQVVETPTFKMNQAVDDFRTTLEHHVAHPGPDSPMYVGYAFSKMVQAAAGKFGEATQLFPKAADFASKGGGLADQLASATSKEAEQVAMDFPTAVSKDIAKDLADSFGGMQKMGVEVGDLMKQYPIHDLSKMQDFANGILSVYNDKAALQDFAKEITREYPEGKLAVGSAIFREVLRNNLLLGYAIVRHTAGSLTKMAALGVDATATAGVDSIRSGILGVLGKEYTRSNYFSSVLPAEKALVSGLFGGIKDDWTQIMKGGGLANDFIGLDINPAMIDMFTDKHPLAGNILKVAALGELPSRLLAANDASIRRGMQQFFIHQWAYDTVAKAGLSGAAGDAAAARLITNPRADILATAQKQANYEMFRAPITDKFGTSIQSFQRIPFVGAFLLPFLNVHYNITKEAFARSPLGFAQLATKKDLTDAEQNRIIARATMGSLGMLGASSYILGDNITGAGPSNPDANKAWLKTHQAYSLRLGDHWMDYTTMGPFALPIAWTADTIEAAKEGKKLDPAGAMKTMVGAFGSVWNNTGYFQNLQNFFNMMDSVKRGVSPGVAVDRFAADSAMELTPASGALRIAENVMHPKYPVMPSTDKPFTFKDIWDNYRGQLPFGHNDLRSATVKKTSGLGALTPFKFRDIRQAQ